MCLFSQILDLAVTIRLTNNVRHLLPFVAFFIKVDLKIFHNQRPTERNDLRISLDTEPNFIYSTRRSEHGNTGCETVLSIFKLFSPWKMTRLKICSHDKLNLHTKSLKVMVQSIEFGV